LVHSYYFVAHRELKKQKGIDFEAYLEDATKLSALLDLCRETDPGGLFILELQPLLNEHGNLNYKVHHEITGDSIIDHYPKLCALLAKPNVSFIKRVHIMPSAAVHFFKHSRKLISADGAHLRGEFDGVVNILTGKDATNRNLSMMYTICSGESKGNWESTVGNFLEKVNFDVSLFISDRDKGLESVKELYGNVMQNCVFAACSFHIAKNVGITSKQGIKLATQMAKAPTREKFEECTEKLKKEIGITKLEKWLELKNTCTFMGLKQEYPNMLTNYGVVNNNASEQQNNKYKDLRDSPIARGILDYIENLNETFTERKAEAKEYQMKRLTVTPSIAKKVCKSIVSIVKKNYCTLTLSDIHYNNDVATMSIRSATFNLKMKPKKKYRDFLESSQHSVTFKPTEPKWQDRIMCSCNYFVMTGYPCMHSAYVLINMEKTKCLKRKKKTKALEHVLSSVVWKYDHETWYSPVFSVKQYLAQYSPHTNLCNLSVSFNSLKQHLILPPDVKSRRGRKKKGRETKYYWIKKNRNSAATSLNLDNDAGDDESTYSSSSWVTAESNVSEESEYPESSANKSEEEDEDDEDHVRSLKIARLTYFQHQKPLLDDNATSKCSFCGTLSH